MGLGWWVAVWLLVGGRMEGFVLVDSTSGMGAAPVVVAANATARTRESARGLADWIGKVCGETPRVVEGGWKEGALPERAVWVGVQPGVAELFPGVRLSFEHPEETLVAAGAKHLLLAGRDVEESDGPGEQGTSHAILRFLEEDLGVRWLWPGPLGTDVPRRPRVEVAPQERRFHPPFRYRVLHPRSPAEWHRAHHLLDDSLRFEANHSGLDWWERFHEAHPEYFALLPEGRRGFRRSARDVKLCVSNPGVSEQWLADATQRLRDRPGCKSVSASPTDGDGFCVCGPCRAMDHPGGAPVFGYLALKERDVKYWNGLARGLRERFPGREAWVGVYAYSAYRTPPLGERLEPNIAVGYVGNSPFASEATRRMEREQWLAWSEQAQAMVYRPNLFHYSGGFLGLPAIALRKTAEDLRFLAEHRCMGLEVDSLPQCWATQGVQYYLMAKLAYDPMQDVQALLEDYYRRGFGPGAEGVAAYFAVLERAQEAVLERVKLSSSWAREATAVFEEIYSDALWEESEAHLRAAEARVADGPAVFRERLAFVRTGLEAARLQVQVLRAMRRVRETRGRNPEAIEKADALCAARDALFKRYGGLAIHRVNWYVQTRHLEDYVDPPSEEMRAGRYKGPGAAPDMKARD
ncbi:MAG: hypothetical protein RLZZ244_782 [Verrucomicrobiota bacterium]|jgi:hypothetical protein